MEIRPATEQYLPEYAEVIRQSFATVAQEFGITRENWPRHTAFITDEQLQEKRKPGYYPFCCFEDEKIVGFAALEDQGGGVFEMINVAVLPQCRHLKFGKALLDYCKEQLVQLGGQKIIISIIEDNARLKNWYAANGFVHTGTKQFDSMPFLVGYMEWCPSTES